MKKILATILTILTLGGTATASYTGKPIGTLEIDDILTVDLATFESQDSTEASQQSQTIVDGPGSCIFRVRGGYYIADHSHQIFSHLEEVQVGDTTTIYADEEIHLECILVDTMGYTDGVHICCSTGERAEDLVEEAYVMYTCAYTFSGNRIVTVWEVQDVV